MFLARVIFASFAFIVAAAAQQPGVVMSEFIFENAPTPSCHASTIVVSNDALVVAWFGGAKEGAADVGIWLSRNDRGMWSAPVEVMNGVRPDGTRMPSWNPVLFQPKSGPLLLFYKVGPSPEKWWGMLATSADAGKTWTAPQRLPAGILGPIKNKPLQLANGDLLSPSSTEGPAGWRVHFERSADLGQTWTSTGPLNDGKKIAAIQPSLLVKPDGALQALGRTQQKRIFTIDSPDRGLTWGPMTLTALPNPNAGTDALTLADGRHLLVYNHTEKGRSPLNVALSGDGKTWQPAAILESAPGEYSYPAVIQAPDGYIHVTYTWKRERIRHVILDPEVLGGGTTGSGDAVR